MPISLKNLLKDIEKEFGKNVARETKKLITKEEQNYKSIVDSTLTGADVVLANLSDQTIQEIEGSIAKYSLGAPAAAENARPNPKASALLTAIINKNIKHLDAHAEEYVPTLRK